MRHFPWSIQVLGGLTIGQGDCVFTRFRSKRTGSLLVYLVCHSQFAHSREKLADLFWPEADTLAGRASLRTALSSLRRQLEPPGVPTGSMLIADSINIRLNPKSFTCDLTDFESALVSAARTADPGQKLVYLLHAIALYKGPLLPGYYDDWILAARERLEAAFVEAQRQMVLAQSCFADLTRTDVAIFPSIPSPFVFPPIKTASEESSIPPITTITTSSPIITSILPSYLTRFFGRDEEAACLYALLVEPKTRARLLTLTGLGGCGKTRLAIVVAEKLREAFDGAVWFVGLSDLQTSRQIPDAFLEALDLPRSAHPLEQIIERLSQQPCLLVLDNFEHLLSPSSLEREDGASFVWTLMQRVPTLTCLVTSRQRLDLSGEQEFSLSPMPVPNGIETPENLLRYACVQLFVNRAQAALPDFQVTSGNARAVAALSIRLEGIPLAIELAAAWAQTLTPAQMVTKLEKRFDLLTSRRRNLPVRHRKLYATVEWSYSLLSSELQRFFIQLSVFCGRWTLEAASAVCEEPCALDFLRVLQERSLLLSEEIGQERRFRLLDTLREFGWEQLSPGEQAALQERRTDYYLRLAQLHSDTPHALENELDNVRRALDWCQAVGNAEKGLRLVVACRYVWLAGYGPEGQYWIKRFLALGGEVTEALRAEAMLCAAMISLPYSDFARAQNFVEQQNSLPQSGSRQDTMDAMDDFVRTRPAALLGDYLNSVLQEGNTCKSAFALCCMGNILRWRGEGVRGRQLLEKSLVLYRPQGDAFGLQLILNSLGNLLMEQQDYADAIALFEESLAHCRLSGSLQGILRTLWLKGTALQRQGRWELAAKVQDESLQICREQGSQETLLGLLRNLGFLAMDREDYCRAQTHFVEGLAIAQRIGHQENRLRHLRYLGVCALQQKEYATARIYFEEHLAFHQGANNLLEKASSLTDIALTFLEEGRKERAFSLLHQSLMLFGDQARMHYALEGIARLAVHLGKMALAAKLFGMAEYLREMRLVELPVVLRVHRDSALKMICNQIGEEAFRKVWSEGRILSQQQALELALPLTDPALASALQ